MFPCGYLAGSFEHCLSKRGNCKSESREFFRLQRIFRSLKKAILYSPLLDREKYTLDENCNVVSKGKDYLECGTYQVSIAYKDEIKTVQFKVVKA